MTEKQIDLEKYIEEKFKDETVIKSPIREMFEKMENEVKEEIKCPILPMYREIVVLMDDYKTRESGLIVKENLNTHKTGKVLALGSGHHKVSGALIPFEVKVGDTIMFPNRCCDKLEVEGVDYLVFDESEVLGICE